MLSSDANGKRHLLALILDAVTSLDMRGLPSKANHFKRFPSGNVGPSF